MMHALFHQVLAQCCCGAAAPPPAPACVYRSIGFEGLEPFSTSIPSGHAPDFAFSGALQIRSEDDFYPTPGDFGFSSGTRWLASSSGFTLTVNAPASTPFNLVRFKYAGGSIITAFGTLGSSTTIVINQSVDPEWFQYSWTQLFSGAERIQRIEFATNAVAGGFVIDDIQFATDMSCVP